MQKETGCAALYLLASDGSCMTPDGERVSLGSQVDLGTHLFAGEDVVVNTALPGKPQMLVFACPEMSGTYRGFAYDAIAIAYYNDTVLNAIDSTAFEGLLPSVMSALSLFERFYTFVNGVFDLTAVFYYLTVAALFLFLSVQSLEKRRYN